MNGAESLVRTLVAAGVDVCFANPGTSEMHFVAALDDNPDMRCVLGLFEGVVTGAADGYARMAERPAATLLHLGPGLGNGLANLHNARRARSPMVNVVGEHATYHRQYDAPLTADVEGVARPMSHWVRTCRFAAEVARDGAEAVRAAMVPPGQIATLILPADTAWNPAPEGAAAPLPIPAPAPVQADAVAAAAAALRSGEPAMLLMNGAALRKDNLARAGRIAAATGARLYSDTFVARIERGAGIVPVARLPYFAEQVEETLAGVRHMILVGTRPPVSFFAYPGKPSDLVPPGCEVHSLLSAEGDFVGALDALAEAVGARADGETAASQRPQPARDGALDPQSIAQAIGAWMPEGAIVVDEAATSGFGLPVATAGCPPHDWLGLTGGSIGQGLPAAVGAAVACPDRKVLSLEADGSGMYTVQALWTMAREQLDVTVVIFSNRKYAILQVEFMRVGAHNPGPKAMSMLDLSNPELNWVQIAQGMGIEASRASTVAEFNTQIESALRHRGPRLIEAVI
ncbi:MAG: acetolactate synthase large subunit [Gammaproteobacteria bacterium]|nr:MAG: acetolactate synthase large subunit [Gammaproteobacteria bacterium]